MTLDKLKGIQDTPEVLHLYKNSNERIMFTSFKNFLPNSLEIRDELPTKKDTTIDQHIIKPNQTPQHIKSQNIISID